jgi:hypothetical protein
MTWSLLFFSTFAHTFKLNSSSTQYFLSDVEIVALLLFCSVYFLHAEMADDICGSSRLLNYKRKFMHAIGADPTHQARAMFSVVAFLHLFKRHFLVRNFRAG